MNGKENWANGGRTEQSRNATEHKEKNELTSSSFSFCLIPKKMHSINRSFYSCGSVTRPKLNGSKAAGDLVLIQTSLFSYTNAG